MAFAHWPSQESFTNTGDGHCRQSKSLRGHPQALGDPPGLPFSTASSALFWDRHGSQPGPGCDSTSQGWEPSGGRLLLKGSGDTCCHRGPLRGLVRTARCETTLSDGNSPPTRNTSSPPKVTHPQPPSTAPAARPGPSPRTRLLCRSIETEPMKRPSARASPALTVLRPARGKTRPVDCAPAVPVTPPGPSAVWQAPQGKLPHNQHSANAA